MKILHWRLSVLLFLPDGHDAPPNVIPSTIPTDSVIISGNSDDFIITWDASSEVTYGDVLYEISVVAGDGQTFSNISSVSIDGVVFFLALQYVHTSCQARSQDFQREGCRNPKKWTFFFLLQNWTIFHLTPLTPQKNFILVHFVPRSGPFDLQKPTFL